VEAGAAGAVLAALAVLTGPMAVFAQEADEPAADDMSAEAPATPTTPTAADPADVESIDAIMAAVYDVISGEAGEARDWDRFMSLFISEARLIASGRNPQGDHGYQVMTPRQFVDGPGGWMVENGFFEDEAYQVTERWADIAHVFSSYNSYRTAADMEAGNHFQRGINSFQLMYDGERWWVVSIFWEGEAPDRPIPDEYLGGS
jgi:hypothetical protein